MYLSMVTSTVAVIITCSGFVIFNIIEERRDMVEETLLVGRILSEEISTAFKYNNKSLLKESFDHLHSRDSIEQVCVYDNKRNEIAKFSRTKHGLDCSKLPSITRRYEFFHEHVLKNFLVVSLDLKLNKGTKGSIYILSNLSKIDDKVDRSLFNATVLFIIIIIISYLISRVLQSNISLPIMHLSDVAYAIKGGNYGVRAKHYSNDEIGDLTDSFNNMLNELSDNRENLEVKVKERTSDLEKALKIKSEFLSNMSHEIRTPIHGIMNYADFLVQDWEKLPEEQRFIFVAKLYTNSGRLLSLINNLLDLSKLDANKMEFSIARVSMVDIVDDIVQESEALYISKKELKVVFEHDKSKTFLAHFDHERISQVIRNLFSNAIKFTDQGVIKVTLNYTKYDLNSRHNIDGIVFTISDEGPGIPEDELEEIFDKFNQSATTRTGAGGTGLGLAICKEIVKYHSGLVWAENNIGKGATFFFIIPVAHIPHIEKNRVPELI